MKWPQPRLRLLRRFLRAMNYPRSEHSGHWRRWLPTWWQALTFTVLGLFGTVILTTILVLLLPYPRANTIAVAQLTTMQWRDGTLMASVGEANRKDIALDAVSQPMRDAILAAEDHDFYKHSGFSLRAIARAALANATGGVTQGGSTITQQYAKNAFLSQDRTGYRKFREILLSVKLETQVDKSQILQDYLNTIWFGRDSYGIQTASWS
ncbi:MAG: biosynthetic peptidoglycan transglycosylase, partial [Actinomycetes bacterium]